MDEKKAREVLDREIARLKDVALTSSSTCMTSLVLAISDKAVQETFLKKVAEGYVFKAIKCQTGIGIPEYRRVEFQFECPPGMFCLIPPSFLVIVDIVAKTVVKIVDPYMGIDPGFGRPETMTISGSGMAGWGHSATAMGHGDMRTTDSLQAMGDGYFPWNRQGFTMIDEFFPWARRPQLMGDGYIGWGRPVATMGDGHVGWGRQTGEGSIGWTSSMPNPEHFVEVRNLNVQIIGQGQAILTAEIRVPNGCYHMGQAVLQPPADIMTVPEQLGATVPVLFTNQPVCTKQIQTFQYQLPFTFNEAQTSINAFVTVNGKVIGNKVFQLSRAQMFATMPLAMM